MEYEHKVRAWMSNYTTVYADLIAYSYPDPDDSVANHYW